MKWYWKGREDGESGRLEMVLNGQVTGIDFQHFREATVFVWRLEQEIREAERRVAERIVAKFAALGKEIVDAERGCDVR